MPRVTIKKKEYKLIDFKVWVIGQMALHHKTQKELGEVLGLTQGEISQKLKIPDKRKKGRASLDPFSLGQVLEIFDYFDASPEDKLRLLTM